MVMTAGPRTTWLRACQRPAKTVWVATTVPPSTELTDRGVRDDARVEPDGDPGGDVLALGAAGHQDRDRVGSAWAIWTTASALGSDR
jgi:hypothetical protein